MLRTARAARTDGNEDPCSRLRQKPLTSNLEGTLEDLKREEKQDHLAITLAALKKQDVRKIYVFVEKKNRQRPTKEILEAWLVQLDIYYM